MNSTIWLNFFRNSFGERWICTDNSKESWYKNFFWNLPTSLLQKFALVSSKVWRHQKVNKQSWLLWKYCKLPTQLQLGVATIRIVLSKDICHYQGRHNDVKLWCSKKKYSNIMIRHQKVQSYALKTWNYLWWFLDFGKLDFPPLILFSVANLVYGAFYGVKYQYIQWCSKESLWVLFYKAKVPISGSHAIGLFRH